MVNIPSPGDAVAAFVAAGHQAEPAEVMFGPCDRIEAEPGPDEPVPFTLTGQAEAALDAEAHDCPGSACHAYPTFDDDPARWGLLPEPEMTEAELEAAALADAWGPAGPSASYAEWVAEGRPAEPEAEL